MKEIKTVCARDCYDTCSLLATLDEQGQILSLRGNPQNPMTQNFTCPRAAGDKERLCRNRVETPMVRRGDAFEKTGWDACLDIIAKKLRQTVEEHGPQGVLYLDYAGNTGLLTSLFPQRLWNAIGATQTDHALCSSSGHAALSLHYGSSHGILPAELSGMKFIVFWGFNAAVSSPHLWHLADQARKTHGTKIAAIDPLKSQTVQKADFWVRPRPGSDVALAYGVMNYLIQNGCIDMDFIKKWTCGFGQLKEEAGKWTPERVARVCDVEKECFEDLAEAYDSMRPSATIVGIGLQKCRQGASQVGAVSLVPALLGYHRGFFYSNAHAFFIDEDFISGRTLTRMNPKMISQVALADLVEKGEFKFIYVSGMNPAETLPNTNDFRDGLAREDVFLVVHETHWTKTAEYADIVLPAPAYLEKEDLVIPWSHNHVMLSRHVVQPTTDCREEAWVMKGIAERMGLAEDWLFEEPWHVIESALQDVFEEGDLCSLKSGRMLRLRCKSRNIYPTPSGRIEFYASRALEMNLEPLPVQAPLHHEDGRFLFLASATPHYTNTQFTEVYGPIPPIVHINPRDAEKFGIKEGDAITLSS